MFGILSAPCRTHAPRLSAEYRPFFCGLATALEELFGYPARVLAGRDAALLSILRSALTPEPPLFEHRRCCNVLGKARVMCVDAHVSQYAAATTMLGLQTKLQDNVQDETGLVRIASRIGGWLATSRLFGGWSAKAECVLAAQGVPLESIREALQSQREREVSFEGKESALEVPAAPTGIAFGELCAAGLSGELRERVYRCGYALGEVFYVVDAWRDLRRDMQRGRFNPLACHPRLVTAPTVRVPEELVSWFQSRFCIIEESLQRLPLIRHRALLEHILLTSLSPTLGLGKYRRERDASDEADEAEGDKTGEQEGGRRGRTGCCDTLDDHGPQCLTDICCEGCFHCFPSQRHSARCGATECVDCCTPGPGLDCCDCCNCCH